MIRPFYMQGHVVAVLGLARSGMATAEALALAGAAVWAWDDAPERRAAFEAASGLACVDLAMADWRQPVSLVLAPGIPLTHPAPHPVVTLARAAGVEVIGDVELLARTQRAHPLIGVTGTNGKSTTTALLGHMLAEAGRIAAVGGNIGVPALALDDLPPGAPYVLELSSYQLDLISSAVFDVAVLLNLSPDHLDRHGGWDGYVAAKRRIFARQTAPKAAVIGVDDAPCRSVLAELATDPDRRVIGVSGLVPVAGGVGVADGLLVDDLDGAALTVLPTAEAHALRGAHNHQNLAAAYAAARIIGLAPEAAAAAARSFPGLAHRQQVVGIVDGVTFVNDSKATNAESAAKALRSFSNIHWLAGGVAKDGGLADALDHLDAVRQAYLYGAAAESFAAQLAGRIPVQRFQTLGEALSAAAADARATGLPATVLLSPACASFDQFRDFEHRGAAFVAMAESLMGARAA